MTGGKLKSRLRLLEYNAAKAAALQAAILKDNPFCQQDAATMANDRVLRDAMEEQILKSGRKFKETESSSSPGSPPANCPQGPKLRGRDGRVDVDGSDREAPAAACESADAEPLAGSQRRAADPAPPASTLGSQGASPLRSGHEDKNAELQRNGKRLREIAHAHNDEAEERCLQPGSGRVAEEEEELRQ